VTGHCGGVTLSETKEETAHRVRAIHVGALTTLGSSECTNQKRRMMMMIYLDHLAPYEGTAWDKRH
jgi:hypothetical protein